LTTTRVSYPRSARLDPDREPGRVVADRRLVRLSLTPAGVALTEEPCPEFNAAEAEVVARIDAGRIV